MRRRTLIPMILLSCAVTACGSDGDGASSEMADATTASAEPSDLTDTSTDSGSAEATDDGETSDEPTADGGSGDANSDDVQDQLDDLDFGDGLARVTIGDTAYEFNLGGTSTIGGTTYLGVCQTLFGLITGGGYDVNGQAMTIQFDIPPQDWESYDDGRFDTSSPRIEIEIDDNGGWLADQTLAVNKPEFAGSSQIDDWVSDGTKASGTATFIEVLGYGAPEDGAQPVQGTFEVGCADDS